MQVWPSSLRVLIDARFVTEQIVSFFLVNVCAKKTAEFGQTPQRLSPFRLT